MRSDLVFGATRYVSNRFLLARLASKAVRKLHKPNTRIEDTTNDVFVRFSHSNPLAGASYVHDLQPLPYIVQAETQSLSEYLRQSVA
jgi:uncharacterized circularly permuted ATP-grasp superfamily protein